ncbi:MULTISPECIES: PrgI family mobile element protein [Pseudobacillus]|uniref:PrgI family mobile element protein n=1 Tax=Pseudobacillus TaxID=108525 RepID=UPI00387A6AD5
MRKVSVPVDMSSEQKVILGIVSMRQLIYLIIGGSLLYTFIPFVFNLFGILPFTVRLVICFVAALPVLAIVLPLAFFKIGKYGMFLDYYLLVKLGGKTQIGVWRKGFKTKKWMEGI